MHRRSFTLVELMVAIAIIGFVSSMMVVALNGASADVKRSRAQGVVVRLSLSVLNLYEEETSRRMPLTFTSTPSTGFALRSATGAGRARITSMRDYLRIVLPDRRSDVLLAPISVQVVLQDKAAAKELRYLKPHIHTQIQDRYLGKLYALTGTSTTATLAATWTAEYESSECLYLILSSNSIAGVPMLEDYQTRDIVDSDGDGVPEIIDSWGTPIEWIRWPIGYWLTYQERALVGSAPMADVMRDRAASLGFDPLDYLQSDWGYATATAPSEWGTGTAELSDNPFSMLPLIVSAGPDREFDLLLQPSYLAQPNGYALMTRSVPAPFVGGTYRYPDPYCRSYATVDYSDTGINMYSSMSAGLPGCYYDMNADTDDQSVDNLYSVAP